MSGQTIASFRVLEKIRASGMGEVYRAHDQQLEREVAIKILPAWRINGEAGRSQFRKEALVLAKLNHPNIETVFEFGNQGRMDFLVTEFIPGTSLEDKLRNGPLEEKSVLRLGVQLADGIAAAHKRGVIHRDLKPGNLRCTPEGHLKIIDFGLARQLLPENDGEVANPSQSRELRGAVPYMPPEQLRNQKADERTDIWAIGTVLYQMATGCRPFPQTQGIDLMVAIRTQPPIPPREMVPSLPSELESIILKTLNKGPSQRYQSAEGLREDLENVGE